MAPRTLALAVLAWLTPLGSLAVAAALVALHEAVPQGPDLHRCREVPLPEPGADADAWASEHPIGPDEVFLGETLVCPRADLDRLAPGDVLARAASWSGLIVGAGVLSGLGFSATALARAWRHRHTDPRARRAARLALSALLTLVVVPLLVGAAVLVLVAAFPIRG